MLRKSFDLVGFDALVMYEALIIAGSRVSMINTIFESTQLFVSKFIVMVALFISLENFPALNFHIDLFMTSSDGSD